MGADYLEWLKAGALVWVWTFHPSIGRVIGWYLTVNKNLNGSELIDCELLRFCRQRRNRCPSAGALLGCG